MSIGIELLKFIIFKDHECFYSRFQNPIIGLEGNSDKKPQNPNSPTSLKL